MRSKSNWYLEVLVFKERGKPEYPEKTSRNKGENQQQTQPTYGAHAGVRTRATLVGGESSQRCAIPCSPRVNDPCNSTAVINEQGLYS